MNRKSLIVLLLAGVVMSLSTGCDGGGGPGASAGPQQTTITAQTSVGGVVQAWGGASLSGDEVSFLPPCDDSIDEYCQLDLSGATTSDGEYTFVTDAMPADWNIAATDPYGKQCLAGATFSGNLTPLGGAQLVCGQITGSNVVVKPASCTILMSSTGTVITDPCPSSVTLSIPSVSLPTTHALSVGTYNDTGHSEASSSITASSSTSITVPAPTQYGASAIVLVDPTTNQVLGAGLFTVYTKTVKTCTGCQPTT